MQYAANIYVARTSVTVIVGKRKSFGLFGEIIITKTQEFPPSVSVGKLKMSFAILSIGY